MNAVRLTVLTGPHKDRRFCFRGPTRCLVGRSLDCFVQLSGDERDQLISRHHCEMKIELPLVHIRDVGSANGTYLNGKKIECTPAAGPETFRSIVEHGDLLTIGGTTFRADFVDCPLAGHGHGKADSAYPLGETKIKDCLLVC